jgi:hypothetical protein
VLAVTLLQPPYQVETAATAEPSLGSIAVVRLNAAADALGQLHEYLEAYPWCASCVVVSAGAVSVETLHAIWGLPGQPGFVITGRGQADPTPAAIAAAVAKRPPVPVSQLVAYVTNRTLSPSLGQTLEQIWAPQRPLNQLSAERTIRHRLRRSGRFGRHDWLRIFKLVHGKSRERTLSVERFAASLGTEPRTVRAWTEECLGATLREYRNRIGWEWVLEAGLRIAGLIEQPRALGAAS